MKKFLPTVIAILSVSCASSAQEVVAQDIPAPLDLGKTEALVIDTQSGKHEFMVEIADEPKEQARGLMFRDQMAEDAGMLFEFEAPKIASIWMKNTALPLDILFVRENGKILKIVHGAKPYSLRSMTSEGVVGAVLELNAGVSQRLGIEPGDVIIHEFFGNAETKN